MPTLRINGAEIHYEEHGSSREAIVFAHGLLFSGHMFDDQVDALKARYRCITFDFRGQGQSQVTKSGYDIDTLSDDAARLIETLGCAPCHFVGLSMGGFVGLRLAIRRPALLKSLVLLETSVDRKFLQDPARAPPAGSSAARASTMSSTRSPFRRLQRSSTLHCGTKAPAHSR